MEAVLRVILFLHSSIASGNNKEYLTAVFKYWLLSRKEFLSEHFAEKPHDSMTYGCKIMVSLTLCHFLDHSVYFCVHDTVCQIVQNYHRLCSISLPLAKKVKNI